MPKEYIERGALINATKKAIERNNSAKYAMIDNDFLDLIADAPTEDVIEVVRCKDCRKWGGKSNNYGMCNCLMRQTHRYNFCCYGEVRECW